MAYTMLYRVFSPLNASAWLFLSIFPLFLVFLNNSDISHLTVVFHTAWLGSHLTVPTFTPHGCHFISCMLLPRFTSASHVSLVLTACYLYPSTTIVLFYIKTLDFGYLFILSTYEFLDLFCIYFWFILLVFNFLIYSPLCLEF